MDTLTDLHEKLDSLGQRIDAQIAQLARQGVMHGAAREKVAEIELQRARVISKLDQAKGIDEVVAREIATDVDILKRLFEKWVAHTDRVSEQR